MMIRSAVAAILLPCFVLSFAIAKDDAINSNAAASDKSENEFVALFNGKNLEGWIAEGAPTFEEDGETKSIWTVEDGAIQCAGKGYGFLRYDKKFADFELRVEFKLDPKCNTGVGIRHAKFTGTRKSRPSYSGYEIQVVDDAGIEPTTLSTGSLYRYLAAQSSAIKPAGEWNAMVIECRGPRIKITLNGEVVQNVDQSTIPEIAKKPLSGYISVQNHGGKVAYRSIRIREISSDNR